MDANAPAVAAGRAGALPSATGGITRLAYARAKAAGVPLTPLLKKAGLTPLQIEDPHLPIKVRDQIEFLNLVAKALDDDFLGLHLAQLPDLREIGLLYYVMASSETLADALQRAARYSLMVNEGIQQKYLNGREFGLSLSYVGVARHRDCHQVEFWMTGAVRICRQLTGLRLLPSRVRFVHRRDGAPAELAEFFGPDIEFGASVDEIVFDAKLKPAPVVSADSYLNKILIGYCEEALAHRPQARGSFRASVENVLAPLLPHGKARASEIARRLGVSQRTFARRLAAEGLTFSDLLEALRSDLALRYLTDSELPISQIAWLLGYQELGAFSHAFKRWTGKSPRAMRGGA